MMEGVGGDEDAIWHYRGEASGLQVMYVEGCQIKFDTMVRSEMAYGH